MRKSSRLQAVNKGPVYREDSEDSDDPGPNNKRKRGASSLPHSSAGGATPDASTSAQLAVKEEARDQVEVPRPAKRVKGKRGSLKQLAEMPLELLFEICGKLDPIDVLNLSRSTKALRGIFMSRSAADIWREALTNVPDLPPCPEDLNEPQWVDLLFGKNCYICPKTPSVTSQTYAWQARLRGCFTCILSQFPINHSNTRYLTHSLLELIPSFHNVSQGRRGDKGVHYHGKTYDEFVEIEKRLTNLEERKKWVDEKKKEKERLVEHAALCQAWVKRRNQGRERDLTEQRNQRREALRERLSALGYGHMIDLVFQRDSFWKQTAIATCLKKDVTSRVWNGIQDKVIEIMETFRDECNKVKRDMDIKKRFKVLTQAYAAYTESRPPFEVYGVIPPIGDVFLVPEIRDVVLAEPLEDDVDQEALDELFERMPEFGQAWRAKVSQDMVDLMIPHGAALGLETVDESSVNLAIATFSCRLCYNATMMHFQRAIIHNCHTECPSWKAGGYATDDEDLKAFVSHSEICPWGHKKSATFDLKAAQQVALAVNMVGLDPKTATVDEMDSLDPIYQLTSQPDSSSQSMYCWRGIAAYPGQSFELADQEISDIIRVRLNESMRQTRAVPGWKGSIYCLHCRVYKASSGNDIRKHLFTEHKISPAQDEDVWIHPDHPDDRRSYSYYAHPGASIF